MPVSTSDLVIRLSSTTATSGFYFNQTDPNISLGKYMASSQVGTGLHQLWDPISAAENAASTSDYRCLFIHNINASSVFSSGYIFISGQVAGGANVFLGVDATPATTGSFTGVQASSVAGETSVPGGVTFINALTYATGISIGNLNPGHCRGLWVRRDAQNSAAINSDGFYLAVQGESDQ